MSDRRSRAPRESQRHRGRGRRKAKVGVTGRGVAGRGVGGRAGGGGGGRRLDRDGRRRRNYYSDMDDREYRRAPRRRYREEDEYSIYSEDSFASSGLGSASLDSSSIVDMDEDELIEIITEDPKMEKKKEAMKPQVDNFVSGGGAQEAVKTLNFSQERTMVGVLGSGDYGRAIAGKIAQTGRKVLIGSRDPDNLNIL